MSQPGKAPPIESAGRRRLLLAGLAGLLLPGVPGCRSWPIPYGEAASIPPEGMLATLEDLQAAARLGRIYIGARPEEGERERLVSLLSTAIAGHLSADASRPSPSDILGALDRSVRADYAAANVTQLQGWLLSITEARLYALAALSL